MVRSVSYTVTMKPSKNKKQKKKQQKTNSIKEPLASFLRTDSKHGRKQALSKYNNTQRLCLEWIKAMKSFKRHEWATHMGIGFKHVLRTIIYCCPRTLLTAWQQVSRGFSRKHTVSTICNGSFQKNGSFQFLKVGSADQTEEPHKYS